MRVLILILLASWATVGMAKEPWYVGAGVGASTYRLGSALDLPGEIDIDGWETGYTLFGGYQLDDEWAIEFGYIDFGSVDDFDPNAQIIGVGYEFETSGIYINAQYHIPLNDSVSMDLAGGWLFSEASAYGLFDAGNGAIGRDRINDYDDNGLNLGLAFTWFASRSIYARANVNYYLIDYDNTIKEPWRLGVDVIWDF